jgi:hypothetical protein
VGKKTEFMDVKPGGAYSDHWTLKCWIVNYSFEVSDALGEKIYKNSIVIFAVSLSVCYNRAAAKGIFQVCNVRHRDLSVTFQFCLKLG